MNIDETMPPDESPYESTIRNRYETLQKIGEGTYGVVFKCVDLTNGQIVAQKKIRVDPDEEGVPSTAIREVSLLREVQHRNCVRLIDVTTQERKLILVFEYLEQDLKSFLDRRATPLVGRALKMFVYQLIDGIHACHSRRIVHRDLKPQNILVSQDGRTVKLADFGLARAFRIPTCTYTHEVVTLWYRAPEILLGARHYLPAVDMWSLGCIMAEMAMGRPLFPGDSEIHQLMKIFNILGTPSELDWPGVADLPDYKIEFPKWRRSNLADHLPTLDPEGVDLLAKLLEYHPHQRINAYQALKHPWFNSIREEMEAEELLYRQELETQK